MISESILRELFEAFVTLHGSQKAAGKALGVSQAYVCDALNGHRPFARKLLDGLGYRKVIMYEQVSEEQLTP